MYTKILFANQPCLLPEAIDWKVMAAWVETEGSIDSSIILRRLPYTNTLSPLVARAILVGQSERAPLDALQLFLKRNGIHSVVGRFEPSGTALGKNTYFRLAIQRVADIDKVIENIKMYLLTSKAQNQVDQYMKLRHTSAERLRRHCGAESFRKGKPSAREGKGSDVY